MDSITVALKTAAILLQVSCHAAFAVCAIRHVQQTGQDSYVAVQDPVGGSPAVLVKRWNITNEKQIELQLEASQEALQR